MKKLIYPFADISEITARLGAKETPSRLSPPVRYQYARDTNFTKDGLLIGMGFYLLAKAQTYV